MGSVNTIAARGFEPLHIKDMGQGCIVLWQRSVSGDRDALVVDIEQLEQALKAFKKLHPPARFLRQAVND